MEYEELNKMGNQTKQQTCTCFSAQVSNMSKTMLVGGAKCLPSLVEKFKTLCGLVELREKSL